MSRGSKQSFVAAAATVLSANLSTLVMQVVGGLVIARALGPALKGEVTVLLVVVGMVSTLSNLGVRQASVVALGQAELSLERVVGSILTLFGAVSTIGILATAATLLLTDQGSLTPLLLALTVMLVPSQLATNYLSGIFLARQEISLVMALRWQAALIRLVGLVGVAAFGLLGVAEVLAVTLFAQATMVARILWSTARLTPLRPRWEPEVVRQLVGRGLVFAVGLFVLQLNYRIDVLLLQSLGSAHAVGIYSIGSTLAEYIWQLPAALGLVVFTRSANARDPEQLTRDVARLARVTALASLGGCVALYAVADLLVPFVYGEAFRDSVPVVRLLLPGIVAFAVFKVLNSDLSGRGHPRLALMVMVPAVAFNTVLNVALIPDYGEQGAPRP